MLRDVDCHIPALCKVIRNHTYQQVTWRSASFSTQQSGEEPENMTRSINEDNAQEFKTEHWPTDIKYKSEERALHISFDNGENFVLPAEYLRVESPSAEVQGHHPSQKKVLSGRRMVGIMGIDPVGNYAVKITFDDLHDTGIFSWQYLYKLATERDVLWQKYLAELESRGLSRDP